MVAESVTIPPHADAAALKTSCCVVLEERVVAKAQVDRPILAQDVNGAAGLYRRVVDEGDLGEACEIKGCRGVARDVVGGDDATSFGRVAFKDQATAACEGQPAIRRNKGNDATGVIGIGGVGERLRRSRLHAGDGQGAAGGDVKGEAGEPKIRHQAEVIGDLAVGLSLDGHVADGFHETLVGSLVGACRPNAKSRVGAEEDGGGKASEAGVSIQHRRPFVRIVAGEGECVCRTSTDVMQPTRAGDVSCKRLVRIWSNVNKATVEGNGIVMNPAGADRSLNREPTQVDKDFTFKA